MKNNNYSEKLKNPKWQKKRLEVLNLRGFKCELCSCETKELHVHHRFYLKGREVWEYDNDVFQVLCCDCHTKEHENKNAVTEKIIEVIPDKYKRLISLLEKLNEIDARNTDFIETIFSSVLESDDYDSFFLDLSYAFEDSFIDVIRSLNSDHFRITSLEIGQASIIYDLQSEIKQLKEQINNIQK